MNIVRHALDLDAGHLRSLAPLWRQWRYSSVNRYTLVSVAKLEVVAIGGDFIGVERRLREREEFPEGDGIQTSRRLRSGTAAARDRAAAADHSRRVLRRPSCVLSQWRSASSRRRCLASRSKRLAVLMSTNVYGRPDRRVWCRTGSSLASILLCT